MQSGYLVRTRFLCPSSKGNAEKAKKIEGAIKDIRSQGANIIIGPINYEDFENVKKFINYDYNRNVFRRKSKKKND